MPKYVYSKTGLWGWIVLSVVSSIFIWLFWLAPILLLALPFLAVFLYLESRKETKHFQELLSQRTGYSICEFARHFDCKEIDTWVIRAVYEQIQNYMESRTPNFPILPSDDIFSDLKIDDEDFEYDIVEEIASRTGRSLKGAESNPYYGKANVVQNLVYFFNRQPLKNAT